MMKTEQVTQMLDRYVSALADAQRLQILAQLIEAPCSISQLSATTGLQPAEISRQLDLLVELNLVESRCEQEMQVYVFKDKTMETLIKSQIAMQEPPGRTPWDGMPEDARRRILNLAKADGTLEYIPSQPKKLLPILEHVAGSFDRDQEYSEKEVNALLGKYTRDTSTLRRFLVDQGFLARTADGARYWKK